MSDTGIKPDGWLIHKAGRGWYRPQAQGYTNDTAEAGRYSHKEAMTYSHPNGWDQQRDGITIKHESEVSTPSHATDTAGLDDICHEEQMIVWSSELMGDLCEWLDFDDYDDKLDAVASVKRTIRSIVGTALYALRAENEQVKADLQFMTENRNKWQDATTRAQRERDRLQAELARKDTALRSAEKMLVTVAAKLPSSVVQKLPTKLLMQWEAVEDEVRAALNPTGDRTNGI